MGKTKKKRTNDDERREVNGNLVVNGNYASAESIAPSSSDRDAEKRMPWYSTISALKLAKKCSDYKYKYQIIILLLSIIQIGLSICYLIKKSPLLEWFSSLLVPCLILLLSFGDFVWLKRNNQNLE